MRIFVSGSLAYDRIMDFPGRFVDHILPEKIHILNVCFMVNGLTERFGGTAGNIAYNLALLGEQPVIVATAGRDFGPYREWLEGLGLPLTGIKEIPGEFTAGAYITTDLADNQITGFNPGAMKHTSDYRFDDLDPAATLAIVAPGSLEDMRIYSRAYKNRGVRYIFDPGQSIPAWDGDDLKEMADGALALIVNDYELEMFRQKTGLDVPGILKLTPHLITTRGEQGSLIQTDRGVDEVPAVPPSQVLDPTGAGDAYRAGLLKGLALGLDWPEAARMGAVLASFCVEQQGTQEHRLEVPEFWGRYTEHFGAPPEAAGRRLRSLEAHYELVPKLHLGTESPIVGRALPAIMPNSMASISVTPSEISPAELLGRIQARFRELGLFGSPLTLTHNGEKYLAACDDQAFAVYRLVDQCHVPPGRPGWPVCLVTAEAVVDETSPPHLADDEFASGCQGLEGSALRSHRETSRSLARARLTGRPWPATRPLYQPLTQPSG